MVIIGVGEAVGAKVTNGVGVTVTNGVTIGVGNIVTAGKGVTTETTGEDIVREGISTVLPPPPPHAVSIAATPKILHLNDFPTTSDNRLEKKPQKGSLHSTGEYSPITKPSYIIFIVLKSKKQKNNN